MLHLKIPQTGCALKGRSPSSVEPSPAGERQGHAWLRSLESFSIELATLVSTTLSSPAHTHFLLLLIHRLPCSDHSMQVQAKDLSIKAVLLIILPLSTTLSLSLSLSLSLCHSLSLPFSLTPLLDPGSGWPSPWQRAGKQAFLWILRHGGRG